MKYLLFGALALACYCPKLTAQENWETYMAKYGDKPGSVLVDLGYKNVAPDVRLPYLLVTGPKAKKCGPDGLPSKNEIDELEKVLGEADGFISGVTAKDLVGTFTYNCQRLNYYYVKDTMGLRNALQRMYGRNYKDYDYVINIKPDREWKAYRTFLYPTDEIFTWIENDKIITSMIQAGDSLKQKRDINFTAYFGNEDDRKNFMEFVHKREYKVDELTTVKNGDMKYEIKISKYDSINPDAIGEMTNEIKGEVKKYHGLYEGWDASINKK